MQGNIAKWYLKEGDKFHEGDLLADIETDKATMGWESQDEGILAKIIMADGSKDIAVGTVVAITVDDEAELDEAKGYTPGSRPQTSEPSNRGGEAEEPSSCSIKPESKGGGSSGGPSSAFPPHEVWTMPALSPTMEQGNIARWLKQVGDSISEGDALCEVETDKAVMTWESTESGFIAKILHGDGSKDIKVCLSDMQCPIQALAAQSIAEKPCIQYVDL
jgi:pyruvate dehydrogenase E2 component (dihydrolipoamide acetyltransferase)